MALTTRVERVTLAVAVTASFLVPFMGSATSVSLPAIGRDLGAGAVALSHVASVYLLATAMFLLPFGRLADLVGRKRVLVTGLVVYAVASIGCAGAISLPWLLVARIAQGVGGAMFAGTSLALVTSVFPPGRRGGPLGLNVAAVYVGLSAGPFVGGVLTDALGWRSLFHLTAALSALAGAGAALGLRGEWADPRGQRFDLAGAGLSAAGLGSFLAGASLLPSTPGGLLTVAGAAIVAFFVRREGRTTAPLVDLGLFLSHRSFALACAAALAAYGATFAVGFLLSLHLQQVGGLRARDAGTVLLVQPVVQALVSPAAGWLSDRVPSRVVASLGLGVITAGLALFATGIPLGSTTAARGTLALLGLGFGLFSSPNSNAALGAIPAPVFGVAAALLSLVRVAGQTLSLALAACVLGVVVGAGLSGAERPEAFTLATRVVLGVCAVLCCAGVALSLARD